MQVGSSNFRTIDRLHKSSASFSFQGQIDQYDTQVIQEVYMAIVFKSKFLKLSRYISNFISED